jgi:pimeloyl-ACP methyl ester carboxylesterase
LFVNPGGPGGSGTYLAASAPYFLSDPVLARFDIVGFDPRGTNFSTNVACWPNTGAQSSALGSSLTTVFPWTSEEETNYISASKAFGRACSSTGRPLSAHMSTAEVARDMDVLRRAVGDPKLTYLGFSYGTYLGDVYANLFPDRVRAIAIDGVLDPEAWAGSRRTANVPQTTRIRSGEGAARAMDELLDRCGTAGADLCEFAGRGDPATNYAAIMTSLQKSPLTWEDPNNGTQSLSYADLTGHLLGDLYSPNAGEYVSLDLSYVYDLLQPATGTEQMQRQATARRNLYGALHRHQDSADRAEEYRTAGKTVFPTGFPYDNSPEAYQTVMCTDGLNPRDAGTWPRYADIADTEAPHFGRLWTWASSSCASSTWTVRDKDAYRGPFTHRTSAPLLVVGSRWDPATNYDSAVKVAGQLPGSRLLSSDNWGHTAYGTSACATDAIDGYLLAQGLPAEGTECHADQPFTGAGELRSQSVPEPDLPPVVPPTFAATPR